MRELLERLGVDPDRFIWQDLALCDGMDTELFYDKYERDQEIAKAVDQVCMHCPVMKVCHKKGSTGQWGVWGGYFWSGSATGKYDKARNSHKTDEVKKKMGEILGTEHRN